MADPGCGFNCFCSPGGKWNWDWKCKFMENRRRKAVEREEVAERQRIELTTDEAVIELNRYKKQFLKEVGHQIEALVSEKTRAECTAIIGTNLSTGRRETYNGYKSEWRKRFRVIKKHKNSAFSEKPSLPTFRGEELDSNLSQPIAEKVKAVYSQFILAHGDVIQRHWVERLHHDPEIQRVFARHLYASVREAVEPVTKEMYEMLVNYIMEHILGQVTDEIGGQMGSILAGMTTNIAASTFSTALAHALNGAIAKLAAKSLAASAFKGSFMMLTKFITEAVVTSLASVGIGSAAAHGTGAVIAWPVYVVLLPLLIYHLYSVVHNFPRKLGKKIAKRVRKVMAGEFESRNRSVMELVVADMFKDGGKEICKALVSESHFAEKSKDLLMSFVEANNQNAFDEKNTVLIDVQ